jgi:hypothetical protein
MNKDERIKQKLTAEKSETLPRMTRTKKGPKLGGNLSPVMMMPSVAGTFRLHFAVALKPILHINFVSRYRCLYAFLTGSQTTAPL